MPLTKNYSVLARWGGLTKLKKNSYPALTFITRLRCFSAIQFRIDPLPSLRICSTRGYTGNPPSLRTSKRPKEILCLNNLFWPLG